MPGKWNNYPELLQVMLLGLCLLSSKNILSDAVPAMPQAKKTKMHIKKLPKLLEERLQYLNLNGMEWHKARHQEQKARRRKFPLFDYSLNYFHKQIYEFTGGSFSFFGL